MYFHLPNQPIRTSVEKAERKLCLLNGKKASLPESDLGKKLNDGKSPGLRSLSSHQYISLEISYAFRGSCFQMSVDRIAPCFPVTRAWVAGLQAMEAERSRLPALLQQNQRVLDLSVHLTQSFLRSRGRGWGWVVGIKVVNFLSASPLK